MPPKKSVIKVISKTKLSDTVFGVRFEYPEKVELLPGQYVSLKVNDQGMRRSYSVAGVGGMTIDLVVDVSPGGIGSKFFEGLVVGQEVEAIGFMGSFVLEQETYKMKNAIFVATGTGIAPYYPMVAQLLEKGYAGKVYLAWGMRYEKDLYWWEKLEEIKEKNKNFDYEIVLSKPDERWRGKAGHVNDLIEKLNMDWKESCAYLCGGNEMIAQMKELFLTKGVAEERIYYEKFY